MLNWLTQLNEIEGIAVKSPACGTLLPISSHPELLYNSGIVQQALCIKLQQNTVVAPFNSLYQCSLNGRRRLRFKHSSGLTLQLDFPSSVMSGLGKGIEYLADSEQLLSAGQPVLRLDPHYLQAGQGCYAALMVLPHPAIEAIFCMQRYVAAATDIAIIIQLKNK
ncbi:phosphotransferase system IIA component [Rheinheimera pacifica]|uniref:PTS glucose transporter subunit IIA n=1 Tax=Rheinheimera pacifica TaxID=173990 RepID=UPI0021696698|nr:PTS glucose transporter subunit IIA [Rheinheimera pacifica]MCS4307621.1 phosphotransferase system IIA component [Rheinheimera pacifica]